MIYLDNAATTFPKPCRVVAETERCMREYCGNPGRGSHALAMAASEAIFDCRNEVAGLFGSDKPENVVFTMNTTTALNIAIKGMLHEGDHVLISDMEHNAVFRPIYKLSREGKITYDIFPTYPCGAVCRTEAILDGIRKRIGKHTRMLIAAHASNICSSLLPIREIGELCRKKQILFVVDAAQSAGSVPIHVAGSHVDALCAPGHKGLLGPQGSGILLLGDGVAADTLTEGGSGFNSLEGEMPQEPPERYEAGTLPTPAIAGLAEGIREVRAIGPERIGAHERALNCRLAEAFHSINGVTVYAPEARGSVLLFNLDGVPADVLGRELDRLGFCVRSGYHCSALGHATLRTPPGGAVRVSPGIYTTADEIDAFADAVRTLARGERGV